MYHAVSAQQQSPETCDALDAMIAGGDGSDLLGDCTTDTECLVVSCMGTTNTTITLFPCEDPIVVNVNVGAPISINENLTESLSTSLGFGSAFNIVLEQIPGGIRFGVSIHLLS